MLRAVSLVLAVSLLSGCATTPSTTPTQTEAVIQTTAPVTTVTPDPSTQIPATQTAMSAQEQSTALANMDFAMLCAAFDAALREEKLLDPSILQQTQVVCADYDKDGYPNILLGNGSHLDFSLTPQRTVDYRTESLLELGGLSPTIYTDKDGNIYKLDRNEDLFDITVDGNPGVTTHSEYIYSQWQDGAWVPVITYKGSNTAVASIGPDGQEIWTTTEDTGTAVIFGQTGTRQDMNNRLLEMGMTEISTRPCEYVETVFDATYWESLLDALDAYLKENYSEYTDMLLQDIDGDGDEEAIFLVPGFIETWFDSLLEKGEAYLQNAQRTFRYEFPEQYRPTGVLVADIKDGQAVVTAHCSLEDIEFDSNMTIRMEDGQLKFDGNTVYQNGSFGNLTPEEIPQELEQFLAQYNYDEFFCRRVDLSDLDGQEYLCVSAKDGKWYLFVFIIIDGNPIVLYSNPLGSSAVFLTEYKGTQALLSYTQTMYEENGETVTQYSFQVFRISENGAETILDYGYTSYGDRDLDATRIAQFFQKPAAYLLRIIVIYDLYQLTGIQWMNPENVDYGETPEEPEGTTESTTAQNPQLGFVQIQDPSSWLNLRVGPGVENAKVLMNPDDPDSFVRQALGSPVTVLETAESSDPANPVWVRVRIIYQDRVIEGWSSKTYIRMIEEVEIS